MSQLWDTVSIGSKICKQIIAHTLNDDDEEDENTKLHTHTDTLLHKAHITLGNFDIRQQENHSIIYIENKFY